MPYFIGIGHSEANPLILKMGKVSLDNNESLGIILRSLGNRQEVLDYVNKFLDIIEEKNNASS